MTRLVPVPRPDLVRRLRKIGFEGPYAGGTHEFMLRHGHRIILPNPHRHTIGADLLARLLRQAGVTREEWDSASE